ncbi:hypothetical protein DVT68_18905 [Dyella solisilvae]|uniref:DUF5666 domain-containing protein n=1 Tax=Dyella solisilvae TaxID=1920168 RepID=A0A370K4L0_9GAMM|nr:hypothetical protein DVT68_18905 [Dyella solisilvae]
MWFGMLALLAPVLALAMGQDIKPQSLGSDQATVTATVVSVNQTTREITLRGPDGNEDTVVAGADVKNLDQLKAGDQVNAKFERSMALEILPAGSAQAGVEYKGGQSSAEKGATPGGTARQSVTVTARLTAIDLQNHTVTLTGSDGKPHVISVEDPGRQAQMSKLKIGDMVRITYTEALAITVTPKGKG